jgi:hypothetical protein
MWRPLESSTGGMNATQFSFMPLVSRFFISVMFWSLLPRMKASAAADLL